MADNDNDAPRGNMPRRAIRGAVRGGKPVGHMIADHISGPGGTPRKGGPNTAISWLIVPNGLWPDPMAMALEQSPEEQRDAANECQHGRLPHDHGAPCGCWPGEVLKTPLLTTNQKELATPCPTNGNGRVTVAAASMSSGPASRTVALAGSAPSEAAPRQTRRSAPGSTPAVSPPSGSTAPPTSAPRSAPGSGPAVTPTPTGAAGA